MLYVGPPPDEPLTQGDILDACPIVVLAPPDDDPTGLIQERTFALRVIVLTQACDLAQGKTDRVVVAPVQTAASYVAAGML